MIADEAFYTAIGGIHWAVSYGRVRKDLIPFLEPHRRKRRGLVTAHELHAKEGIGFRHFGHFNFHNTAEILGSDLLFPIRHINETLEYPLKRSLFQLKTEILELMTHGGAPRAGG